MFLHMFCVSLADSDGTLLAHREQQGQDSMRKKKNKNVRREEDPCDRCTVQSVWKREKRKMKRCKQIKKRGRSDLQSQQSGDIFICVGDPW